MDDMLIPKFHGGKPPATHPKAQTLSACIRPKRKCKYLTFAIVVLFSMSIYSQTVSGSETLRVMTYNLRYASDTPPNAWADRLPVAVAMLKELAPAVIGTQEALYRQVKDLDEALPEYSWIGLGRDGGSRGEFMAVFYKPDRLVPLEFDHFWLSDTPEVVASTTWGNTNRRMVTWVRFRDKSGGEFYFWNTHFDHRIQQARQNSAQLVLDRVRQLPERLPVILVGDFNAAHDTNPVYQALVGDEAFADTWKQAKQKGHDIGTFHNYEGPRPNGSRIDWILTQGPVDVLSSEVVTFSKDGQYPSDHFPVIADLQLHP